MKKGDLKTCWPPVHPTDTGEAFYCLQGSLIPSLLGGDKLWQ